MRMPAYQAYKCTNTTGRTDCFLNWFTQTKKTEIQVLRDDAFNNFQLFSNKQASS